MLACLTLGRQALARPGQTLARPGLALAWRALARLPLGRLTLALQTLPVALNAEAGASGAIRAGGVLDSKRSQLALL